MAVLFVQVNLQGLALGISQGGMGDITASKKTCKHLWMIIQNIRWWLMLNRSLPSYNDR